MNWRNIFIVRNSIHGNVSYFQKTVSRYVATISQTYRANGIKHDRMRTSISAAAAAADETKVRSTRGLSLVEEIKKKISLAVRVSP